ncbi:MAG: inorganic pyrophosphatase [Bdellovibrionales bacterium]
MPFQFQTSRPHPWHGISPGKMPPVFVTAYIEITPSDGIKYEIDKETGYLKVDRPQVTSSLPPALYGFIPKTFCHDRVGAVSGKSLKGDQDPLDICVFSERAINRSEVLVPARVIGGLRMVDKGEADDKIIAVLDNDPYWASVNDIAQLPAVMLQRLQHYFLTYKLLPNQIPVVTIDAAYGLDAAKQVVTAALEDYKASFK